MVFCTTCGSKLEEHWIVCPNCGTSLEKIDKPKQIIITPQQETIIPQKISNEKVFKRKKKKLALIICLVAGLVGGFFIGGIFINIVYMDMTTNQKRDLDALQDDYNELLDNYNALYELFAQYQAIIDIVSNPLTDPDIPTINEVVDWLAYDNTDTFTYTENFMCGDFSVMLMGRAKVMNWRMRVACMFWSYEFESGWQNPSDPYGSYGHAFNVILCQDYNGDSVEDWFYIEPQTDQIWYVVIDSVPFIHYEIWGIYSFNDYSGTVWSEPYYITH